MSHQPKHNGPVDGFTNATVPAVHEPKNHALRGARGTNEQVGPLPVDAGLRAALPMADCLASWMKAAAMERGYAFVPPVRGATHAFA